MNVSIVSLKNYAPVKFVVANVEIPTHNYVVLLNYDFWESQRAWIYFESDLSILR